jgi:heme-degrading monooxygenase HmoA
MVELLDLPPTPEAIASMSALPGAQIVPTMIGTMRGPEGHHGPEAAGAILMLQATFISPEGVELFWRAQAALMGLLNTAPGFIRSYGFGDGPTSTLLVFWRSAHDAKAFSARPEHRQAMRDLYEQRWEYSHFAGIWEMTSHHQRVVFCPDCPSVTSAGEGRCQGCGTEILDIHRAGN